MNKKNVREAALEILEAIDKHQSYSNLLLNQVIKKQKITGPDTGLLTEIVYGTIQRKMTIDFYLQPFLKKKIDDWVRILLRMSLYQMVYLDKIPDRAIIFESVEIAKKRGHKGIAGLVNGILRSVQRQGLPSLETIADPLERLAIETSHPQWLIERWVAQFGIDTTKTMCEENLIAPMQSARVNMTKATRDEVMKMLDAEGFAVQPSPIIPEAIKVMKGNLVDSDAYRQGYITIQDESSMAVAHALEIAPNMKILDACAAPGGKTGHIAEVLDGTGIVEALDLHPHKVKLILENTKRLGLQNIVTKAMDSRQAGQEYEQDYFDRILIDAPCSGLGVLRRKPDIKYTKTINDIQSLGSVQQSILDAVAPLVKKTGLLVYSTCTVDNDENIQTVEKFIQRHPEFEPHPLQLPESLTALQGEHKHMLQIFPQDFGGDGFFISCFLKK
ncbi:16S rRNA (cytosine(967)-C(5))-methyltransferase RsmB [Bacillus sp. FSL K6-3431]|uniref:16S rRNA (cytosine(967)-C(5))-methyltransferase RsmB n=1 Tax=Bacillus sp. FSL K6-3431 TaxID=2921500 RepID=UPI0030F9C18A